MSHDPLTAGKAALEERDRVRALAAEARVILNRLEDLHEWPYEHLIRLLMSHGFSWAEANDAVGYLDWEDNRHDGESDP